MQPLGWMAKNLPRAPSGPPGPAGARPRAEAGLAWGSVCCGVAVEHGPSWAEKGPGVRLPQALHQEAEAWGPLVASPPGLRLVPARRLPSRERGPGGRPGGRVGLGFRVSGLWWALGVCSTAAAAASGDQGSPGSRAQTIKHRRAPALARALHGPHSGPARPHELPAVKCPGPRPSALSLLSAAGSFTRAAREAEGLCSGRPG